MQRHAGIIDQHGHSPVRIDRVSGKLLDRPGHRPRQHGARSRGVHGASVDRRPLQTVRINVAEREKQPLGCKF